MTAAGIVTWGSVPVPYTAMWSGETPPPHFEVRRVPGLGGNPFLIEGASRPGDGKPKFSTFHVGRAVEVLSRGVCQICRSEIGRGEPVWCIGNGATINGYPHITDGLPMCQNCCALSLRHCPALSRQRADGTLRVYLVFRFGLAPAIVSEVSEAVGGNPAINAALRRWHGKRPVFGTPKIYLTSFDLVSPDDVEERSNAGARA